MSSSAPPVCTPSFECAAVPSLSKDEVERFSRQIMVEGIGAQGMARIRGGSVCCVGAGGLGSTIALYLCAAGVGRLVLVDFDEVEVSNLHRQVIHTTDRVGMKKVASAKVACLAVYPDAKVDVLAEALTVANAERVLGECDVVVDGSDNVAARYLINDAAMRLGKPLVSGSAMRWEGQLTVYGHQGGPCYRCLFPQPPPPAAVGSCNDSGVMGPVPGMIGCLQALEVLKLLSGAGEVLSRRMLLFDGLRLSMRVVTLRPRQAATCPACGDAAQARDRGAGPEPQPSLADLARSRPEYVPVDGGCGSGVALSRQLLPPCARSTPGVLAEALGRRQADRTPALEPDRKRLTKERQSRNEPHGGSGSSIGKTCWSLCVDVRASVQFDMCHLPGSRSLPLSELQAWQREGMLRERWNAFLLDMLTDTAADGDEEDDNDDTELASKRRVFLICRRGIASAQATQLLLSSLASAANPSGSVLQLDTSGGGQLSYSLVNVDGGLNAYHLQVDKNFPYY